MSSQPAAPWLFGAVFHWRHGFELKSNIIFRGPAKGFGGVLLTKLDLCQTECSPKLSSLVAHAVVEATRSGDDEGNLRGEKT